MITFIFIFIHYICLDFVKIDSNSKDYYILFNRINKTNLNNRLLKWEINFSKHDKDEAVVDAYLCSKGRK